MPTTCADRQIATPNNFKRVPTSLERMPQVVRRERRVDAAEPYPRLRIQALHKQYGVDRALAPIGHDRGNPDLVWCPCRAFQEIFSFASGQELLNAVKSHAELELVAVVRRQLDCGSIEALLDHCTIVRQSPFQSRTDLHYLADLLLHLALRVGIQAVEQPQVIAQLT